MTRLHLAPVQVWVLGFDIQKITNCGQFQPESTHIPNNSNHATCCVSEIIYMSVRNFRAAPWVVTLTYMGVTRHAVHCKTLSCAL